MYFFVLLSYLNSDDEDDKKHRDSTFFNYYSRGSITHQSVGDSEKVNYIHQYLGL